MIEPAGSAVPSAMRWPIRRVCVVGAGTIGASWAAFYLSRGLEVVVSDPSPNAPALVQTMIDQMRSVLPDLTARIDEASALFFESDPAKATEGADFVQENGPENYETKRAIFARLDAVLPPEVIIASSSSGLLVSRLSEPCRHPERIIIGHPFNPPHLIPLVEVVGGQHASRDAIDGAMRFYRHVGKRPIEIKKEVPGHLANRLQAALWREAVYLVSEGVASVADVDAAVTDGPGLRWALMGPHATFHLAGGDGGLAHFLDHLLPAVESWWADLGAPHLDPNLQKALIEGVLAETKNLPPRSLAETRDTLLARILAIKDGG